MEVFKFPSKEKRDACERCVAFEQKLADTLDVAFRCDIQNAVWKARYTTIKNVSDSNTIDDHSHLMCLLNILVKVLYVVLVRLKDGRRKKSTEKPRQ